MQAAPSLLRAAPPIFLTFLNFQLHLLLNIYLWRLFCQFLDRSPVCWLGCGQYLVEKLGLGGLRVLLLHHLPNLPAPKSGFCQESLNSVTTKWLTLYYPASQHMWLNSHLSNVSSPCTWGLLLIYQNDECSLFQGTWSVWVCNFYGRPSRATEKWQGQSNPRAFPNIQKTTHNFFSFFFHLRNHVTNQISDNDAIISLTWNIVCLVFKKKTTKYR